MVNIKHNDTRFIPRSFKQSTLEALVINVIKDMEDMESFASLAEQVLGVKVLYVAEDSEKLIVVVPDEEAYFNALGEFNKQVTISNYTSSEKVESALVSLGYHHNFEITDDSLFTVMGILYKNNFILELNKIKLFVNLLD